MDRAKAGKLRSVLPATDGRFSVGGGGLLCPSLHVFIVLDCTRLTSAVSHIVVSYATRGGSVADAAIT